MIVYQKQPTNNSCVSTCVAMLLNVPAEKIIEDFHDDYFSSYISLRDILNSLDFKFQTFNSIDINHLSNEGVYFVTVPSLNVIGGLHQILIEVTEYDYNIFDPAFEKVYVKRGEGNKESTFELGGFVIDAFISHKEIERVRSIYNDSNP